MIAPNILSPLFQGEIDSVSLALVLLHQARIKRKDPPIGEHVPAMTAGELCKQGLTKYSLEWLVAKGLLAPVQQQKWNGSTRNNSNSSIPFHDLTLFSLTATGLQLAEQLATPNAMGTASVDQPRGVDVPFWDNQLRKLYWQRKIVKQFRTPAQNQERILDAFDVSGWASRIENPLTAMDDVGSQQQLHEAVRRLNGKQREGRIRFTCDGTGRGICWEGL